MANKGDAITTKFSVDVSELKAGIQEANRQIRLANSEFKAATGGMDDWSKSADGLSAKLRQLYNVQFQQNAVLDSLEKQLAATVKEYGENSKAADDLRIKINNQKAALGKTEKDIRKYKDALDSLETSSTDAERDIGDLSDEMQDQQKQASKAEKETDSLGSSLKKLATNAEGAGTKVGSLAKTLSGGIVKGIKTAGTAILGATAAFLATGEASQETMENMGKLETAFTTVGHSSQTAQQSYRGMVGILGEMDQSVEAVNHLARLTKSQEELAQWTTIAAGVYATFGDSLPLEGLTEAANETAKVGEVTGPLADALNWAGVSEDAFNEKLKACSSEQERASLITSQLVELYGEAGNKYQQTNADLIAARQAQSDLNLALAETGKLAMPVTTAFKQMGANLLTEFLPSLKQIRDGIMGVFNMDMSAGTKITEGITNIVTSIITKFTSAIPQLSTVGMQLIFALVNALITNAPQVVNALFALVQQMITTFSTMAPVLMTQAQNLIMQLVSAFVAAAPQMMASGVQLITMLVTGLVSMLPTLMQQGALLIQNLISAIVANLPLLLQSGSQIINTIVSAITTYLPLLLQAGGQLLIGLSQGIMENMPNFVSKALDVLNGFADFLTANLPIIIQVGIQVITNLVMGLVNALPTFIAKAPEIISKFANLINDNMPTILKAGVDLILNIIKGIISAIPTLVENVPKIITAIVDVWEAFNWLNLGKKAIDLLVNGIKGMISFVKSAGKDVLDSITNIIKDLPSKLLSFGRNAVNDLGGALKNGISAVKSAATSIMDGIVNTLSSIPGKMADIGKNIVQGLWNGINDMVGWVVGKIQGFGESVLGGIKSFFGIASPSKVLRKEIGRFLPEGLALGIADKTKTAVNAMKDMGTKMKSALGLDDLQANISTKISGVRKKISGSVAGLNTEAARNQTVVFNQYNNSPKALSRLDLYRQTKSQLFSAKERLKHV